MYLIMLSIFCNLMIFCITMSVFLERMLMQIRKDLVHVLDRFWFVRVCVCVCVCECFGWFWCVCVCVCVKGFGCSISSTVTEA